MLTRRSTLALLGATAGAGWLGRPGAGHAQGGEPAREFRIGYQKSGGLVIARRQEALEKRLAARGIKVSYIEFQAGPPLLEALNLGAIDFGTTGDTPPIFAQAARANLVYVATIPAPGAGSAILVKRDGPIRSLADLKGRTIGFTKGSSAHNFTVNAVKKAGLAWSDIKPAYLSPADAGAAFANGSIDAWTIWDPFYAIAEKTQDARVLTTAEGIVETNSFYLANGTYAKANPGLVRDVLDELTRVAAWATEHPDEVARALAEVTGVALEHQQRAAARTRYAVTPVTEDVVRSQQAIADEFARLGLIPRTINVREAVWTPPVT
ncbi:sulfonate ABC transporter substrate-binding protein [Prosthecomicrobium sp. N25]|uniref:sulfonate ABC transporter substrate-binding protein n=1 Tax=Prosthecomicrobium sp. N25 TaxID=3129254 RepID=UPI00307855A2